MGINSSTGKCKIALITPEQMEKLRDDFNKYDANGNHVLERNELDSFLSDRMPDLLPFSRVIMHVFGSGKKGTISFDKFKLFYQSLQKIGVNEKDPTSLPMLIFAKLDANNNYYISSKELEYLLHLLQPKKSKNKPSKKDAKKLIHEQNPSREEWGLSRDEFIKFFDNYISSPSEKFEYIPTSIPQIMGGGYNKYHQIGENPKPSQPTKLYTVGGSQYICISAGESHTVIITEDHIVYGLGSNEKYQLGGDGSEYTTPTLLSISVKNIVWATCGESFTVFITEEGRLVFCGPVCIDINPSNPRPYEIESKKKKKFVYASACSTKFCAIDLSGYIYVYNHDPRERPFVHKLSIPVYDVACGYSHISGKFYAIAVTVSGEAYGLDALNGDLHHFSRIHELSGIRVKRVYGYSNHLAVLTSNGQIMTCGCGNKGQCGNGNNESSSTFQLIKCKENLVFTDAAVGESHSVFITQDGQVYSCGDNSHFQLLLGMTKVPIFEPTQSNLIHGRAVAAACGSYHTIIVVDAKKIQHPGMTIFGIDQ